MEVWKDIKDYEGHYQISNYGMVKSVERPALIKSGYIRIVKERFLSQEKVIGGYKRVSLSIKGKLKRFSVHRLVAIHFIDDKIKNKEVNHLDKNTSNNRVENLEWISRRENATHKNYGSNKFTGIHKLKNSKTYQVKIYLNGKNIYLGSSTNLNKAKKIYNDFINSNNIKNKYICH